MPATAADLRAKRKDLLLQAQKLNDEKADEDGLLPAEYQQQFDEMFTKAGQMLDQAERQEKLEKATNSLDQAQAARAAIDPHAKPLTHPGEDLAETTFAIRIDYDPWGKPNYHNVPVGPRGSRDYQTAFNRVLSGNKVPAEQMAALQSDDADQAGYLVASEQFAAGILKEVDDLVFVRRYARIHTVREADSLGIRKRTSRMNTFGWSAELEVSGEDTSLKYGKKVLTPHHLTGLIKVSRDLLRRSVVPVEGEIRFEFARDSGEKMEDGFLTGDGAQKPLGVFVASADGISTARDVKTGSATDITSDGLVTAKYALKSQYRNGGARQGCRWLFHRDGVRRIALLKDNDGHYMFRPGMGIRGDDPDFLLGFPLDESERSPNTFVADAYVGLLANWRYYEIADALDMEIQVLVEKYAETNQVGYIGRLKNDGMPTLEEAFVRLQCGT